MAGTSEDDYQPSDLVWAKMRGYPQWPARIVPKPRNNQPPSANHYFVFFYGSHDVAWMSSKDLLPFEKYQAKFRRNSQRQRPGLNEAIWEAEEDPELILSEARPILQELEKVGKKGRKKRPSSNSKIKEGVNKRIKSESVSDYEIKGEQQKGAIDKSQQEEDVPEQHRERRRSARLQTSSSDVTPKSTAKRKKSPSPVPDHPLSPPPSVTKKRKEDLTEKENKTTTVSLSEPTPTHSYSTRTRNHNNNGSIVQQLTSNYSSRREITHESTYQEIHSEEMKVVEEREQAEEQKSDEVQSKRFPRKDATHVKESSEIKDKMETRVVKKPRTKRKRRARRMQEGDKVTSSSDNMTGEEPSSQTDHGTENEVRSLTITIPLIENTKDGFLVKCQSEDKQTLPTTTSNTTIEHEITNSMNVKKLDSQSDVSDQSAQAVDNDLLTFIEDSATDQANSREIDVTHQTSSGEGDFADQTKFENGSHQVIPVGDDPAKVYITFQTDSNEKTKVANEISSEQGRAILSPSNQANVNESTSDTTGHIEGSTSETNDPVPNLSSQELTPITEECIIKRYDVLQMTNDVHNETNLANPTTDDLGTVPMKDVPIVISNDEIPVDVSFEIENSPNNSKILRATSPLVITADCVKEIIVTENIHVFTFSDLPTDTTKTVPVLIVNSDSEVKIPDIITDTSREMEENPVVSSNDETLEIKLPDSITDTSMEVATDNVPVIAPSDETLITETSNSITDKSMEVATDNVPVITPSDEILTMETSDSITDYSMEVATENVPVITPSDEILTTETSDSITDKSMEVATDNVPVITPSDEILTMETSDSITDYSMEVVTENIPDITLFDEILTTETSDSISMEVATENVPVITPSDEVLTTETSDSITDKSMEVATENVPVITPSDETLTTETSGNIPNDSINVPVKPSQHPLVISKPSTSATTTKANSKEPKKKGPPQIERAKVKPITDPPAPPRPPEKKKHPQAPRQVSILPSMSMIEALKAYNYNLKASLVVDLANTQRALKHLRDLLDLEFTTSDIEEVKDLVNTLRKVRRYKGLARVRNRADEVYTKIKLLYMDEEAKPKPKKSKKDGETVKRRPSSVVDQINKAAEKSKAVNGTNNKTDTPDSLPEESDPPCASSSEKKSIESVDKDGEDSQEKENGRRRSRRTALRGRVNYSELCSEGHISEEEQTVPQL